MKRIVSEVYEIQTLLKTDHYGYTTGSGLKLILSDCNQHIKAALDLRDELTAYLDAVAPGLVSPVPDGENTNRAQAYRQWADTIF